MLALPDLILQRHCGCHSSRPPPHPPWWRGMCLRISNVLPESRRKGTVGVSKVHGGGQFQMWGQTSSRPTHNHRVSYLFTIPSRKVQATGPTWRCPGQSLLSTLSQQHCLPDLLSCYPKNPSLCWVCQRHPEFIIIVMLEGSPRPPSSVCAGGLPGALEEERSLWNRRHSEHPCRWAEALCSARPGGCYGKQPTCLCHGEHGRAIVRF